MGISLDKVSEKAPGLLSLAKKAQVSLQKKNLTAHTAKVALVADFSGSMRGEYRSGKMQELAEKVLALATQFDDDGAIDFFLFDSRADYVGEVSLDDYKGSIDRLTNGRHMGTTNYTDAFYAVLDHYKMRSFVKPKRGLFGFGKQEAVQPAQEPVYVLFLTDGSPDNRTSAAEALKEVSNAPIFWQFLSIGSEYIKFLEKLDDMDGRFVDNADYKPVGDLARLSDDKLFDLMIDEYPSWVEEVRRKGLIR